MPDAAFRPPYIPADTVTPERDITHAHFASGDRIVILKGAFGGNLCGEEMTVIAPSWHTPTDEDGWRLRNPHGGERTFITAHPRYMVHVQRYCPDCAGYLKALGEVLLPQMPADRVVDGGWYTLTALDQLVHNRDLRDAR
ncbi:hypothetical protein DMH15_35190 [Streptomyces sp. WAC 06725]|uniref:hypothetical protein n=1 Tax=Streptomyces sp. WAC 06725 TaxID=2203209 RepID=UPI000F748197|nr:hypothetical protein [Streptomyces sp. WAC 06725]RSO21542.1 hypothetical protein DMH15_35190 [Streptomyces sp. WAC 06725]